MSPRLRVSASPRPPFSVLLALLIALAGSACHADEESPRLAAYHERVDQAVNKGLTFLAAQQITRTMAEQMKEPYLAGSFRGYEAGNTGITSLGVLAFLSKGYMPGPGRYGQVIAHGIDYVLAQQHENGLLGSIQHPGNSNGTMYAHGIATLLLTEASGMVDPERQKKIDVVLPKAMALLLAAQQVKKTPDHAGGWRYQPNSNDSDLSLTGWSIMALRAGKLNGVPIPKENIVHAVEYILRCRVEQDGGFAYQPHQGSAPGLTGCAILCLELCGEHGNKVIAPAGEYILSHLPQRGDLGMKNYYAFYYCSQASFQLGSRYWETWAPHMYDSLLVNQKPDGSWPAWEIGETYSTAMSVLAMTVAYRQLPIYQRDDSYEEGPQGKAK
jgi:hypothetical protein